MADEKSPARISHRLFATSCSEMGIKMKILLTAVNSKYIHSNLAVYSLKAYHDAHSDRKDTVELAEYTICLLYTSPSPRDVEESRMPSSA